MGDGHAARVAARRPRGRAAHSRGSAAAAGSGGPPGGQGSAAVDAGRLAARAVAAAGPLGGHARGHARRRAGSGTGHGTGRGRSPGRRDRPTGIRSTGRGGCAADGRSPRRWHGSPPGGGCRRRSGDTPRRAARDGRPLGGAIARPGIGGRAHCAGAGCGLPARPTAPGSLGHPGARTAHGRR